METCKTCACDCQILSDQCIKELSEISQGIIIKNNYVRNATNDIDDLIGILCAEEMCKALEEAVQDLEDAGTGTIEDYLDSKWINIVNNKHFQTWYAYRVNWHLLEGSSITELQNAGLVQLSNTDEDYKNGFSHASEKQRARLQQSAALYAEKAKTKFLITYWNCNLDLYDCIPSYCDNGCKSTCGCGGSYPTGEGIGLTIL